MAKELTPRQQEVKALTEKGQGAAAIAKRLGISENAVYQHLRAIRGGPKQSGGSRPKRRQRATSRRQSAPTPPRTPATAEELLRSEIDLANASKAQAKAQIEELKKEIAQAESAITTLDAEIATKGDVLDVLTGKKVAQAKRPARKRPSRGKQASGQSSAKGGSKAASGQEAAPQPSSNGGSATAEKPKDQAEREATADHDGGAEATEPAAATA